MIGFRALKDIFHGSLREASGRGDSEARGRIAGLRRFHDLLGLETSPRGGPLIPIDERGFPRLREGRARAREFGLRPTAEAIMGHEFVEEYYHPSSGYDFGMGLSEAAIDPTSFLNINTYNLATAGLIFAEVMERFNHPDYIGRNLVRVVPTKRNGDKLIGVARFATATAAALGRQPGEPHVELAFGEAYQTTPETVERAAKCMLTRESVFYDITDQVMDQAGDVGDQPAYRQEIDIADHILGVTNSYNRNGTSFNTYQTATPYINDQSNPFSDETDIDDARQLFVGMTDPETGREIRVDARTILCMPSRELKFREQLFGPNVQVGTQLSGTFPTRYKESPNQIGNLGADTGAYTLVPLTSIWYNRALAADGLGLSAANAKEYWWLGEFGGPNSAFEWRSNWDLTPWTASADELTMKDRGLVAVYGANFRGVPYSREPRRVVRSKN